MNNSQFRRLLLSDQPKQQDGSKQSAPSSSRTPGGALGARKYSSIPMTPRQVGKGSVQADFARQLAERNAKANPQKKSRASAPKGTKLAAGYTDRTKERVDDEDNEIAKRIKNLEEAMKLGQIDRETFEKLVSEITGGDVGTTHLVKGLDRKLLERVRRGEDVLGSIKDIATEEEEPEEAGEDVEDAFNELAEAEVGAVTREKVEKKGEKMMAPPPPVASAKRTRADILAELKRQREEAAKTAEAERERKFPTLGAGFRKITRQGEQTRIEIDDRGREVLIITAADGKEKRKVRKQKVEPQTAPEIRHDLDDATKPINMHNLPEPKKQEDSEDDDIFAGVGSSYNPLANLDDDDGDEDSEEEGEAAPDAAEKKTPPATPQETSKDKSTAVASKPSEPSEAIKRDYFKSGNSQSNAAESMPSLSSADATVRAALAKVKNLDEKSTLLQNLSSANPSEADSKEARLRKRAAELAASDRDMEDIDMGFGESRFDDADEMEREGEKVKFSEWKGLDAGGDDDDEDGPKAAKKRKRGPKKRKGDVNNADDVLQAMERQKEKKTKTLG
ncbi:uncharacterized protein M421DRAFT_418558 [Didymella exigua CBS 183.55]|uniref:RED-like N-terminal domain-containing protein n=1 Tax=Didymella exigua CBS 183.55 TaxID=1150837 RepID=A0A6A5RSB7_9PLEO|nr:uncharacterized protein M421DRAFT_418558 [Didymella exigua CBS 183.55]KAF1930240.1 hypothetical protein M421DRAFT_418558 [Didymella exigua CBS 183.55]